MNFIVKYPKYAKIIGYLSIVSFYIAGLYTGRREFFLIFFTLFFLVLFALILNLWTAFSFSFIQDISLPIVVKGSMVYLKIGIYNDKPFPFTLMKIRTETVLPDKTYELRINLPPNSNIDYTIPVHCPYRGVYGVGMTKIEINDIFGLVKTRFDMRSLSYYKHRSIKILPKLIELPYLPTRDTDARHTNVSALHLSEDGDSYSDLRRYRPGDPLKKVHKPVSARHRELYVKTYDIPLENAVLVAIDAAMDIGVGEPARYLADIACECAVAIAAISMQSGFNVEFVGADVIRVMRRGRNKEQLPAICEALADIPFNGEGDLNYALESVASNVEGLRAAYIISSSEPAVYADALLRLQRDGCFVCFLKVSHTKAKSESESSLLGINIITITPGDDIRLILTGEFQ
jgi:uncharacterized protein (DUF58 family)